MLVLNTTSDVLQLITSAAGQIDVYTSYADVSGTTVTVGRQVQRIGTATTTTVLSAPGSGVSRNAKRMAVANNSSTVTNTVTWQFFDGTNTIVYESFTLAPGERFSYSETAGIRAFTAAGLEKTVDSIRTNANANTADVVANAADTYLTGANLAIGGRVQATSFFKWRFRVSKSAAGVVAPTFIIRLGTAGAIGDTARVTFTSTAAQTAVTDAGMIEIDGIFTATGASAVMRGDIRMDHTSADGAGMGTFRYQQVTSAAFDVTPAATVVGISCNPGTAGVWTFQMISVEADNLIP
jgi:hypothetical protein